MPTLMYVADSNAGTSTNASAEEGSTTMYNSDDSTVFEENVAPEKSMHNQSSATKSTSGVLKDTMDSPIVREKHNKSVTFDESFILMSTGKRGRFSRRDTLNSDVSLLSCDANDIRNRTTGDTIASYPTSNTSEKKEQPPRAGESQNRVRQWPQRDEYTKKYQSYVKATISGFELKYPGKLRDYRSLSLEEKSLEQKKVLALLNRLGVSKHGVSMSGESPSVRRRGSFRSPVHNSRLIDETLSPLFSPNSTGSDHNKENEQSSIRLDQSRMLCEKSELLLSDDEDAFHTGGNHQSEEKQNLNADDKDTSNMNDNSGSNAVDFPVENDEYNVSSDGSMEVVRKAPAEDSRYSGRTPERLSMSHKPCRKREASSSGKRGADMRRSRHNEQEKDDVELCAPFGRLSISPSISPPPQDLFITSQSPISPRLTYNSPKNNQSDEYSDENYMSQISLGRDSEDYGEYDRRNSRRDSNITNDSLATTTPSKRYASEKDKRRAFRDVPVNVVLKKGATFHLEKIAVKRTERVSSKSGASKNTRIKAPQRRRLVNFPDPLVRYSSRRRRALKEMYSWVRRAENEFEQGRSIVPAVGAFFSLSEQQIIDLSLKLFLSDYADQSQGRGIEQVNHSSSTLQGNTLVVARTKEDTAVWESALREGTGCAVLNHSSMPLSERIRGSTAEKACMYDVVLTTYDAVKSPDIAIAVTNSGRAITTKTDSGGGWHSSRNASQVEDNARPQTKKLSVLHRIQFKRIIFVGTLGRKCYLAKGSTARATASVALSSSSCRLVFFKETEADGQNALLALRKSDKGALQSVSSVLHLTDHTNKSSSDVGYNSADDEKDEDPLENIAMDLKDLVC